MPEKNQKICSHKNNKKSAKGKVSSANASTSNQSNNNNNNNNNISKNNNNINNRSSNNKHSTLSKQCAMIAENELNETPENRKNGLRDLRVWLRGQKHLAGIRTDDSFLLRFLRFKKFNMDDTQAVIDKYVQMRTNHPEWFQNLDIRDPKMRELLSSGYIYALPERDDQGRRVIFSRASAMDASRFTATDIMRAHILVYETLLADEENQVRGLTYVFDEREINWGHVAIWSPSEISKAFSCCERALPLRHQEINFVHLPWTMAIVFQFAKSLLSQKLRDRFQTHASFDKLAKEFPAKRLLPTTCGGERDGDEMVALWLEELECRREEVMALDEMHYGLNTAAVPPRSRRTSCRDEDGSDGVLEIVGSVRKMEAN